MIRQLENAEALDTESKAALVDLLYQLADDELFTGHRLSEWLGVAPDIEEDVAFASIAQDEIGHAAYFYGLLEKMGEGQADSLAFARDASKRRNAQFVERPNRDWANAIAGQFLYDTFELVRLTALSQSTFTPLAKVADKMLREEQYHLLHMDTWFRQLANGGRDAKSRLDAAIRERVCSAGDLCQLGRYEDVLVDRGIFPLSSTSLYARLTEKLQRAFQEVGLTWVDATHPFADVSGRLGFHSGHLDALLETMSEVYRIDPDATW